MRVLHKDSDQAVFTKRQHTDVETVQRRSFKPINPGEHEGAQVPLRCSLPTKLYIAVTLFLSTFPISEEPLIVDVVESVKCNITFSSECAHVNAPFTITVQPPAEYHTNECAVRVTGMCKVEIVSAMHSPLKLCRFSKSPLGAAYSLLQRCVCDDCDANNGREARGRHSAERLLDSQFANIIRSSGRGKSARASAKVCYYWPADRVQR